MNYPNHKHSKYIDQNFSFNNRVDFPKNKDLNCNGIMLTQVARIYQQETIL